MSAPRSSLRALRAVSKPTATPSARRNLHITGVQSAQPANGGEKAISNHDLLQSRAFSIAMRRINGSAFSEYVPHIIPAQSISIYTHLSLLLNSNPNLTTNQLPLTPPIQHIPRLKSPKRQLIRRLRLHAFHGRPRCRPSTPWYPSPGLARTLFNPGARLTFSPTHEATDLHRVWQWR